ncbi:MAG: hypothetical protein JWR16_194 [Nevskia sp.]|nr:hypothetical protein [Nevskia sp.]
MWSGYFHISQGYAIYEGAVGDSHIHAHAAFQIAIGLAGTVTVDAGLERLLPGDAEHLRIGIDADHAHRGRAVLEHDRERAGAAADIDDQFVRLRCERQRRSGVMIATRRS